MICLIPLCTGVPGKTDHDGNIKTNGVGWVFENPIALFMVQMIRWLSFILLYGGIITVVVAVYTMTPETANGRGAVPLIGDGKVPGVDVKVPGYDGVGEPKGVNDIPTSVQ